MRRQKVNSDDLVTMLLGSTINTIEVAVEGVRDALDDLQQAQVEKLEDELTYFYWFALDYWLLSSATVAEERDELKEVLREHLRKAARNYSSEQSVLETLEKRLITYDEILNEKTADDLMFIYFHKKLSEYTGISNPILLPVVTQLFSAACNLVRSSMVC